MAKNNRISSETEKIYTMKNALVNYFLALMFTVFPLFYTEQYTKIRHDKLYFFLIAGLALIFIEGTLLLYNVFSDKRTDIKHEKKWYNSLSVTDYAFGGFILTCIISTILSKYPLYAISGTQGRNNGLLLMCIYFGIYIIISRLYVHKEYILPLFAVTSIIVFTLCILNFHYIDPLSIFNSYSEKVLMDFTSTIGNKNLMASFCCISVPVFLMLYIHTGKNIRYLYLICTGVGFAGLICTNSECGFLGIMPTLAIILIYASKDYKKLFGFFSGLTVMLICGKLLSIMELIFDKNKNYGSIQSVFINSNIIYFVIFLCLLSALFFYFRKSDTPSKVLFYTLLFSFIAGVIVLLGLTVYFTFIDTETKLEAVSNYLRFSEKWGFIWIKSFEIFFDGSIKDKLFGIGPDNYFFAFAPYFSELTKFGDSSTNTAHNEVLHYLVTIGLVGAVSYLILTISAVIRAFKCAKNNPLSVIFVSAIICYFFQSLVNIAQPITTPLLFIFIALTESIARKSNI